MKQLFGKILECCSNKHLYSILGNCANLVLFACEVPLADFFVVYNNSQKYYCTIFSNLEG